MPARIDHKKARTTYKHGVLKVTIPKIKEKISLAENQINSNSSAKNNNTV